MRIDSRRGGAWLVATAVVLATAYLPTGAHHAVLRFNLEEMTMTADRVLVGRCVAVDETTDLVGGGRLPITRYTFEVERALKGSVAQRLVVAQLGHPARRASGKGSEITMHGKRVTPRTFLHGMSEYHVDDRVVLFLIPNYLGGKVTYPVGLYQGAFFVSTTASGRQLVRNSINNLGLFTAPYNGTAMKAGDGRILFPERDAIADAVTAKALSRKRGALPLDEFLAAVEEIHAAHGGVRGKVVAR